ncbi:MAG: DUF3531 family protein [Thermostichales cyanobacterium SZTDM-1c_bins_54]
MSGPELPIRFRDCRWSQLWIWIELVSPPSESDQAYLQQVLESWYTLGVLGGFNAGCLPIQEAGVDLDQFVYPADNESLPSLMHNLGDISFDGCWLSTWADMGTADGLALDILCNALTTLSREYVLLKQVVFGGEAPPPPL